MIGTDERIKFISESLNSYKEKIKRNNKVGLFDSAKMFEIFACRVCAFYFNKNFSNLNQEHLNFPYVDLVSEDNSIYIQVSTTSNIKEKVNSTLKNIDESEDESIKKIICVYFFILECSDSDCSYLLRPNKFTSVKFNSQQNIITFEKLLQKATTDYVFQDKLYTLLKENEEDLSTLEKIEHEEALENELFWNNTRDRLINNEYEIDRTECITKIEKEKKQFVLITGLAGSGKTSLAFKLLENKKHRLYFHADKLASINNVNEIWEGIDVKRVFKVISDTDEELSILIDSLESISNYSNSQKEILKRLFLEAYNSKNINIVMTCRTFDANLLRGFLDFDISIYEVKPLNSEQLDIISRKYPIIDNIRKKGVSYANLLELPFYVNLLVKYLKSPIDIFSVRDLNEFIYDKILCLSERKIENSIRKTDIKEAIEKLVFERTKNLNVGILKSEIDSDILKLLERENLVSYPSQKLVRLKYDIYEDIVFQHHLDDVFEESRDSVEYFFNTIKTELAGRCNRQYQIWIGNIDFSDERMQRFILSVIGSNTVSETWVNLTILGILKSARLEEFFSLFDNFIDDDFFKKLLELTELYLFIPEKYKRDDGNVCVILQPVSNARSYLVKYAKEKELHRILHIDNSLINLCTNYILGFKLNEILISDDKTIESACEICQYYVDEIINRIKKQSCFLDKRQFIEEKKDLLESLLQALYRAEKYSYKWITAFWKKLIDEYETDAMNQAPDAEDLIEFTLNDQVSSISLSLQCPKEYSDLARSFWLKPNWRDKRYSNSYNILPDQINSYETKFLNQNVVSFIPSICKYNQLEALLFVIDATNDIANRYKKMNSEIKTILLRINSIDKEFISDDEFWLVGLEKYRISKFIGDSVYYLVLEIVDYIDNQSNENKISILNNIKSIILHKANNAIMLSVLKRIGIYFKILVPDYLIDLLNSIELIEIDFKQLQRLYPIDRYISYPVPRKLYDLTIIQYANYLQLNEFGNGIKDIVYKSIDSLYQKYPGSRANAEYNLLIQKMDLRKAKITETPKGVYVTQQFEGAAKEYISEKEKDLILYKDEKIIHSIYSESCNLECNEIERKIYIIRRLDKYIKENESAYYVEDELNKLIYNTLQMKDLTQKDRSFICSILISITQNSLDNRQIIT